MKLQLPTIINLPRVQDDRGNLSFVEELRHVPFEAKRVFWIYDVPGGEIRGGHAYQESMEFIVALSGSFSVITFDGTKEQKFALNRSYFGLYIPSMIWRHMEDFSTNSLALVVTSTRYNPHDYIRDFEQYKKMVNE